MSNADTVEAPVFSQEDLTDPAKREVLLEVYRTHAELLHRLTQIDLRIFGGFITIQFVVGGFILKLDKTLSQWEFIGAATIDAAVAFVAYMLIFRNFQRRDEAAEIMRRLNCALGLREIGYYVQNKRINYRLIDGCTDEPDPEKEKPRLRPKMDIRPWKGYYYFAICFGFVGLMAIIINNAFS